MAGPFITDPFTRRVLEQSGVNPDDPNVVARLSGQYIGQQPDTGVAGNIQALVGGAWGSLSNTARGAFDLPLAVGRAAGLTDARINPRQESFAERANPNFAGLGALGGVIGQFALGGGLAAKGLGKLGGMLGKLPTPVAKGLGGAASFGAFEGLQPGELDERAAQFIHGARVGGIFSILGAPAAASRLRKMAQGAVAAPVAFGNEPVLPDVPIPPMVQQLLFGAGAAALHGKPNEPLPKTSRATGKPILRGIGSLPTSEPPQARLPTFDPTPRRTRFRTAEGPQRGQGVRVPDIGPAVVPGRQGFGPRVRPQVPRGGIRGRGGAEFGNDKLAALAEKGPPLDDLAIREAWEATFTSIVNRKPERYQKPLEPKRDADPTQTIDLDVGGRAQAEVGPLKPTGRPLAKEVPFATSEVTPRGAPARDSSFGYLRDKLDRISREADTLADLETRIESVARGRHSGQRMSALEERQKLVEAAAEGDPRAQVKLVQSIEGAVERALAEAGLQPTATNFHMMRQKIVGELSGERPRVLRPSSPEARLYDAANKAAERYINALRRACRGL